MTAASWACTALLCWHLNFTGAVPREVTLDQVRPYATGEKQLRVLIVKGASALTLRPDGAVTLQSLPSGERLGTAAAGARITVSSSGRRVSVRGPGLRADAAGVSIIPLEAEAGTLVSPRHGWGRRSRYSGVLEIARQPEGLRVVECTDLETYIAGVVAAELPSSFPPAAMEAQAVAARTYALQHLGDHEKDEADLCARVHCQAYAGMTPSNSPAAQAAHKTAGLVLSWNGVLADTLYHSACGGATAPAWEVRQSKLLPYLRGAPDTSDGASFGEPYCGREHDLSWTRRLSRREAEDLISSNLATVLGRPGLSPGRLNSLRAVKSADGRRVAWLEIYTDEETYRVRGDSVRWLFGTGMPGPGGLRSTAFDLEVEEDASGEPRSFLFRGVGYGHGLGLCQWGARGRALYGQSAAEILGAYYPGAAVTDLRR